MQLLKSNTILCGVTVPFCHSFHFCTFKCKWSSRRFFIREMTADYLYRWLLRNFLWFLLANSFTVHNLWTIKNENLACWEITVNGVNGTTQFFYTKVVRTRPLNFHEIKSETYQSLRSCSTTTACRFYYVIPMPIT